MIAVLAVLCGVLAFVLTVVSVLAFAAAYRPSPRRRGGAS